MGLSEIVRKWDLPDLTNLAVPAVVPAVPAGYIRDLLRLKLGQSQPAISPAHGSPVAAKHLQRVDRLTLSPTNQARPPAARPLHCRHPASQLTSLPTLPGRSAAILAHKQLTHGTPGGTDEHYDYELVSKGAVVSGGKVRLPQPRNGGGGAGGRPGGAWHAQGAR